MSDRVDINQEPENLEARAPHGTAFLGIFSVELLAAFLFVLWMVW